MGMGMGMGSAMLLRAEAVQKELGVTEEQVTKLKEVFEAGRGRGGQSTQSSGHDRRRACRRPARNGAKRTAEQEKKIGEILDAKQAARLKQIRLQASGVMAVAMNEELAKELSVTEEQTTKIRGAVQEMRESMRDAGPGGFAQMGEKMNAKVMEVLTDAQKAKYKEMCGEPFDVAQLRRGGPGGARRGGN